MNIIPPISTKYVAEHVPHPDWRWTLLTSVAKLESGHTPSRRRPEYWSGDIPWLSLKDIKGLDSRYVRDTMDKPTVLGIENSSARLLSPGTVALCRTASVGKVVILGREMATSQDFANWVCGPKLDPEYLYWAIQCSSSTFKLEKQGSTHKTIYMPVLERLNVLLPPLEEQRRIAAILDKADAIRRKRQKAIALTEQLLRSTFLEMFGDPVTNPKGWPCPAVKEVVDGMPRNGLSPSSKGQTPGVVLTLSAITRGCFNPSAAKHALFEGEIPDDKLVREHLLLVCRGNGNLRLVGAGHFPTPMPSPTLFPDTMIGVPVNVERMERHFFEHLWNSPLVRTQLESSARTTNGTYKINQSALLSVHLIEPPISRQRAFGRFCGHMRGLSMSEGADRADNLFNSLTQQAFTGQL